MMCMTELHEGVCHRTSTPHKSGNKMKEKKKELALVMVWVDYEHHYVANGYATWTSDCYHG